MDGNMTPKGYWICFFCAKNHHGKWPKGHCATSRIIKCETCEKKTICSPILDWDWPNEEFNKKNRKLRD